MIRVELPHHLRTLARVNGEVQLDVEGPATQRAVLDALEARYPVLCGTIRDHVTLKRRPFLRFFACEQDLSHEPPDALLPEAVASGRSLSSWWGRSPADERRLTAQGKEHSIGAEVNLSAEVTPTMKFRHCVTEFHGIRSLP